MKNNKKTKINVLIYFLSEIGSKQMVLWLYTKCIVYCISVLMCLSCRFILPLPHLKWLYLYTNSSISAWSATLILPFQICILNDISKLISHLELHFDFIYLHNTHDQFKHVIQKRMRITHPSTRYMYWYPSVAV